MIGLIRADVLNLWAGRVTAPAELPRLVRLLIQALAGSPMLINFPADEVNHPGIPETRWCESRRPGELTLLLIVNGFCFRRRDVPP